MILFNAQNVFCKGKEDPLMIVNGVQVWPLEFSSYDVVFIWTPSTQKTMCIDGMGWGNTLDFIHAENVNWADYYDGISYESLTNSEIINACNENGTAYEKYCVDTVFSLKGSDMGRFYEFSFKTGTNQTAGTLKVRIIGNGALTTILASKTFNVAADTTYHVHIGEFDT